MAAEFAPRDGLHYGALGLPLAFVALPLYVHLPAHYATRFGLSLASLGALLLAARALDAVVDPWIGRLCDRALGRPALAWQLPLAALLLAAGFTGLFFPLPRGWAAVRRCRAASWPGARALRWSASSLPACCRPRRVLA